MTKETIFMKGCMKTRKYAYASSLVSPYKFVSNSGNMSRHNDKFHSEAFSFQLRVNPINSGWLTHVELGIVNKEELVNDYNCTFSDQRLINREY